MQIRRDHIVIASILLLAAFASVSLAWLISINSAQIEKQLLDELALDEMEELGTLVTRDAEAPLPETDMVDVWLEGHWDSGSLPEAFHNLEQHRSHRIKYNNHSYHVFRDQVAGHDAVIAIDLGPFQARRQVLRTLLIVIALLAPISTALMGVYYLSKRLTPVVNMAKRVANLDPSIRGVRLAKDFKDGEMRVIADAFDTYQERLDRFVEREQAFCEAASHELRTPLATLSAGTEVIMADSESLSGRAVQTVERMHRSAQHMSSLLNGLMWLVRENEVPSYERVELGALVSRIIEQCDLLLANRSIRCSLDKAKEVYVKVPVGHFDIVLGNIFRNAIQHTPQQGEIDIRIFEKGVEVKDNGSGIEANYLNRIFERDFRRESGRGGLGLYLSQKICDFHQWKLTIHSEINRGTMVRVDLSRSIA